MIQLLDELEEALSDLLQAGADTGAIGEVPRFRTLAAQCEGWGLHTGSALVTELADLLEGRNHQLEKEDLSLTEVLCRTVRYLDLCREKLQEEAILERWQGEAPHESGKRWEPSSIKLPKQKRKELGSNE